MSEPWKDTLKVDDLVHSPIRLSLLIFLLPRDEAKYREIQKALGLTAGNLTTHLKKLEAANLIEINKKFVNERPVTNVIITYKGRQTVKEYTIHLHKALGDVLDSGNI